MEIQHIEPGALPRQKRIKVSKACYTCRVKKIKCDGLNPCMQCKARQRPCSFSVDGADSGSLYPAMQSPTISTSGNSTSPPSLSPRQATSSAVERPSVSVKTTASGTKPPSTTMAHEQHLLEVTTQRLDTLGQAWPGCEYEDLDNVKPSTSSSWPYQQQNRQKRHVETPPLSFFLVDPPNQQPSQDNMALLSTKMVSPTSNIQHTLISLYYRHRYRILPILPKSTLLHLLNRPSTNAFISPLLLSAIYAQAAQTSASSSSDADHYAASAKSMLDSHLDTPQLSTVIALVLMSLYESNRHGYTCSPCQASMYLAMAIRMCFDLNLHNSIDEGPQDNNSDATTMMVKALKLRVFWSCYCLDKWTSLCTHRPWMIHSADIGTKMELNGSLLLGMEGMETMMNHEEQTAIEGLVASVHLAQLGERLLQESSPVSTSSIDKANQADHQLLSFLQHLPASLNWTPLPTPDSLSSPTSSLYQPIPSHPPHNSIVGQFHLIFNLLHLTLLTRPLLTMTTPPPSSSPPQQNRTDTSKTSDKNQVSLLLQRCSTVATNLTQLGCALTDQTGFILCYRMVSQALMLSIRVHLIQCYSVMQPSSSPGNDHHRTAKHARLMFQRSLRSLRILVQHRVIPGADTFTTSMERILQTLALVSPPHSPHQDRQRTSTTSNNSHQHYVSVPYQQHYQQQQHGYLSAEQSAAEVLSNAFNTTTNYASSSNNSIINNSNSRSTSDTGTNPAASPVILSRSSPSPPPPSAQPMKQQEPAPLVDVSSLYTSVANNPLYHQQIQPHFGYSLPSGKQDEIWALQEQFQQQQQQQPGQSSQEQRQYHSSPSSSSLSSSSSSSAYTHMNMYSTQLWPATQMLPNSTNPMKKSSSTPPTGSKPSSSTPADTSAVQPYKSIGLGVYASAQRHHSDVIGQHFGEKSDHRPVILNRHGQVVVASSGDLPP